ncbi:MAG: phage tail protein [Planctomycetota bacterium]|jgi:hypothetical protein
MNGLKRCFIIIVFLGAQLLIFGGCSDKKKKPFYFPPATGTSTDTSTSTSTDTGTDTGTSTDTGTGTSTDTGTGTDTGSGTGSGTGTAPAQAANPSPANGAAAISLNPTLTWDTVADATTYEVYFGITNSPIPSVSNQASVNYTPTGPLAADTTFYWRIDTVNDFGTTPGTEWWFRTGAAPGAVTNLSPPDGNTSFLLNDDIFWNSVADATSYDVYFGTVTSPPFAVNQTGNTYDPGLLSVDTTYYWRIDAVNAYGTTPGTEWWFRTGAAPGLATNPDPTDGNSSVSLNPTLTWDAVADATTYAVYFGNSNSPVPYVADQTGTSYVPPGPLNYDTTYYWRIDTINDFGNTTGTEWSFKTIIFTPASGDLDFADNAGSILDDEGHKIASLPDGSFFVTGSFQDSATFDPGGTGEMSITSAGGLDIFIAAYNSDGSLNWVVSAGGTGDDSGHDISILDDGTIYIAGSFRGSATFGSGGNVAALTSAGQADIFIARYDSNGILSWARNASSTKNDEAFGVSAVPDGSAVFIAGEFRSVCTFGEGANQTTIDSGSNSKSDIFVARYGADGALHWVERAGEGSNKNDGGTGIAALADGGALVTGYHEGATFDPLGTPIVLTSAGGQDIFIAKYNADGSVAWAESAGSSNDDSASSIAAFPDNSFVIAGQYRGTATFDPNGAAIQISSNAASIDVFLARYLDNGTAAWAASAGGAVADACNDVDVLLDGTVCAIGQYDTEAVFGSGDANETGLTSAGLTDIFVAKFNSDGTLAWAKSAGGTGIDEGMGITMLPDGSCIATGYFTGTATFGPGEPGETTLVSGGGAGTDTDIFIARFFP